MKTIDKSALFTKKGRQCHACGLLEPVMFEFGSHGGGVVSIHTIRIRYDGSSHKKLRLGGLGSGLDGLCGLGDLSGALLGGLSGALLGGVASHLVFVCDPKTTTFVNPRKRLLRVEHVIG